MLDELDKRLISRLIEANGLLSLVITKFRIALSIDGSPMSFELNDILEKSLIAVAEATRLLNAKLLTLPGEHLITEGDGGDKDGRPKS